VAKIEEEIGKGSVKRVSDEGVITTGGALASNKGLESHSPMSGLGVGGRSKGQAQKEICQGGKRNKKE